MTLLKKIIAAIGKSLFGRDTVQVSCDNGHPLDEPVNLPPAERRPCPQCGSIARAYGKSLKITQGGDMKLSGSSDHPA